MVENGENADNQDFVLFQLCFLLLLFWKSSFNIGFVWSHDDVIKKTL